MESPIITYTDEWESYTFPMVLDVWLIGYWESGAIDGWVIELFGLTGLIEMELAPFIIAFLGVLIGAIMGIGVGVLGYRGNFRKNIAALSGILMIGLTIILIIWVQAEWGTYVGDANTYVDEWGDPFTIEYQFDPGFGIIGPFIGGVFCLASGFIKSEEREIPIIPKKPELTPTSELRYCPECGAEAPGKFCPNCGKAMLS